MGVYIKGMEMPTRCAECRLSTVHSFKDRPLCDVLVEYMSYGEWEVRRLDNCPLVPVPPHGDLIDYDFCMQNYELLHDDDGNPVYAVRMREINSAPTIIPETVAEEGE